MAKKWHVSSDGVKRECRAHKKPCTLLSKDPNVQHFTDESQALEAAKKINENKYGSTKTIGGRRTNSVKIKPTENEEIIIQGLYQRFEIDNEVAMSMGKPLSPTLKKEQKAAEAYLRKIANGEIPEGDEIDDFNKGDSNTVGFTMHQSGMSSGYYAKITKRFARGFKDYAGDDAVVMDPLAGRGFLAKALQEQGLKVIASDDFSWAEEGRDESTRTQGVENMKAMDAVEKNAKKATHMVVSWAPIGFDEAALMDKAREVNPNIKIVHIGEGLGGGCTGNEELYRRYRYGQEIEGYQSYGMVHDSAHELIPLSQYERDIEDSVYDKEQRREYELRSLEWEDEDWDNSEYWSGEDYSRYKANDEDLAKLRAILTEKPNNENRVENVENYLQELRDSLSSDKKDYPSTSHLDKSSFNRQSDLASDDSLAELRKKLFG